MNEEVKHLVAWDCDLKRSMQYNEFSLIHVEQCNNVSNNYLEPLQLRGQLIQAKRFENISVLSCKMKSTFYVAACTWRFVSGYKLWSKTPQITDVYLQLTRSECEKALNEKS